MAKIDVKQAGQHANPGGEKMEIPAWAPDLKLQDEGERQIDQRRSSHGSGFAPIETWVSEEYGDSAQG